jgi:hypothetical protein
MNIKRAFLVLAAALLMPGLALAQDEFGPATFTVDFNFEDFNDWDTTMARISCNGGLPLENQQVVRHGSTLTFVLTFADEGVGVSECVIKVDDVSGYTAKYLSLGDSEHSPDLSFVACIYNNIFDGDENLCEIDMQPAPVGVAITKEWVMTGAGGNTVDTDIYVTVWSDGEINGGDSDCYYHNGATGNGHDAEYCTMLYFSGDETRAITVVPEHGGTVVFIDEEVFDSSVETDNGCGGSVTVTPGGGAQSCLITNTVFFEGIPTLNQYGLAIMALLMLGVGFVGFRRFV